MTTTLITGASSGIGEELAERFAQRGHDLILVARRLHRLEQLATRLETKYGMSAATIPLDLSEPEAASALEAHLQQRGLTVDTLINNAGFASHGDIATSEPATLEAGIRVNCQALVGMTTRLLPSMLAQGHGTVINIASTAAFQPVPHMAVYAASKAFVLSFTEALWSEVKDKNIRVLAVCPGSTDTEFFDTAGEKAVVGKKRTVAQLIDHTMRTLDGSKPSFVDGASNALIARIGARLLPKRQLLRIAASSVQ